MVLNSMTGKSTKQYVSFRIDDYLMGIDITKVREVNLLLDITPVQHAPDFVRGLINLRGQIVTVLDLGIKLGRTDREITQDSHNIILKHDDVGILVDSIGDVIEVFEDDLEIPPANMDMAVSYIDSVIKLDKELMMVISPEMILEHSDLNPQPVKMG
ncbi:MAG: chemotaxis protein CheW [Pseudomonadota bacterium]